MRAVSTIVSVVCVLALAAAVVAGQEKNTSGAPWPEEPTWTKDDQSAYGKQIALFADRRFQGWVDEVSRGVMTLFTASGDSVRRGFTRMSLENAAKGDKTIIKFTSPADIKGVTALTHENSGDSDDNWLYLPASKRVRRISGANNTASFQGTEFTYEDLSIIDPAEYEWRFEKEDELDRKGKKIPVFKLNAVPTYRDTGYSRIVVYIHREHWRQERVEYFDKAGRHLKTRDSRKWKFYHGRFWRELEMEMANHQTGKRTMLELPKVFLNLSLYKSRKTGKARKNLTASRFTTRAIQS